MILTDEEVDLRLSSSLNLINILESGKSNVSVLPMPNGGRTAGAKEIPPLVRKLIANTALTTTSTDKEVAAVFGISQPVVSNARRGLVDDRFEPDLMESINETKKASVDSAHELALDALVDTLQSLKPHIKSIDKPKDLSKIATDMSKIVGNLKPASKDSLVNNVQVVLFSSNQKKEKDYEFIEA